MKTTINRATSWLGNRESKVEELTRRAVSREADVVVMPAPEVLLQKTFPNSDLAPKVGVETNHAFVGRRVGQIFKNEDDEPAIIGWYEDNTIGQCLSLAGIGLLAGIFYPVPVIFGLIGVVQTLIGGFGLDGQKTREGLMMMAAPLAPLLVPVGIVAAGLALLAKIVTWPRFANAKVHQLRTQRR